MQGDKLSYPDRHHHNNSDNLSTAYFKAHPCRDSRTPNRTIDHLIRLPSHHRTIPHPPLPIPNQTPTSTRKHVRTSQPIPAVSLQPFSHARTRGKGTKMVVFPPLLRRGEGGKKSALCKPGGAVRVV